MSTKEMLVACCILGIAMSMNSCSEPEPQLAEPTDLTLYPVIPLPVTVTGTGEAFFINETLPVSVVNGSEEVHQAATLLGSVFSEYLNAETKVNEVENLGDKGIFLEVSENADLGDEGYLLRINKNRVLLTANNPAGLFYGIQTIRQLISTEGEYTYLPAGEIWDKPEYGYRGTMLDVARHFFTVEEVKTLIDYMAVYKLNYLHLHLADDQGWRIEIKSWPKLTEIGGSSEVGGGEGGFYTQEEYSDIVTYAAQRHITIVPEIDMPGHTNAALASYPELNCDDKAPELYTGTEVGFSTLCTDKEITYEFVNDVVREISELTPGPYFHIGGDESHVTPMEDYIPFINRVQEIVAAHGKTAIGWDEIANATMNEGTIAQFWARVDNTKLAIDQGAQILMSPAWKAYLDMQYDSTSQYGLHWAAYIPVDSAYQWSPETLVPEIKRDRILGIEAPLWSETVADLNEAEYLIFPRLLGYAEIGWTPSDKRQWEDFRERLAAHGPRMKKMGIDFYESSQINWKTSQ